MLRGVDLLPSQEQPLSWAVLLVDIYNHQNNSTYDDMTGQKSKREGSYMHTYHNWAGHCLLLGLGANLGDRSGRPHRSLTCLHGFLVDA